MKVQFLDWVDADLSHIKHFLNELNSKTKVITDLKIADSDVLVTASPEKAMEIMQKHPLLKVVVSHLELTADGIERGFQLGKAGVMGVTQSTDVQEIAELINKVAQEKKNFNLSIDLNQAVGETQVVKDRYINLPNFVNTTVVGTSEPMRELIQFLAMVNGDAQLNGLNVITLLGRPGVGKSAIARMIGENSPNKKFVEAVLPSIQGDTFFSQFTGHMKGSFTGADQTTVGYLGNADKGVLFLDEIGNLSLESQAQLLSILQDGTYTRKGEDGVTRKFNGTIVAATNKPMLKMAEQGLIAEDFLQRIMYTSAVVPTLNERIEDLPLIAQNYSERLANITKTDPIYSTKELTEKMMLINWDGNVRQFEKVYELMLKTAMRNKSQTVGLEHLEQTVHQLKRSEAQLRGLENNKQENNLPTLYEAVKPKNVSVSISDGM